MDTFIFSLNAVLPIILVIGLGYFLKKIHLFDKSFLSVANKVVFKVALPVMLFVNIYNVKSLNNIDYEIIIYSVLSIIAIFIIGLLIVIFFVKDEKQKGVILQCAFRSNFAIIGIPLAEMLFGAEAGAVASIVSACTIPVFNILAVFALTIFIKGEEGTEKISFKQRTIDILKKIVTNPLIIGVVSGILVLCVRELFVLGNISFRISTDLEFLYTSLSWVKNLATPLALIVLGGAFEFSAVKRLWKQITLGTVLRVIVAPLLGLGVAYLCFNFSGASFAALVALYGSPVATSSAIMAKEMNNDDDLAGQLVVWTTIFSSVTLFIIIMILKSIGIF